MNPHNRAKRRIRPPRVLMESVLCLKYCGCFLVAALALDPSCSKKPEPAPAELANKPSHPTGAPPEGAPAQHQQALTQSSTEATTQSPVSATATSGANSNSPTAEAPPNPTRSPAEIAQMFKTTGDRQAAIAAIRQFATNTPASFPELSALLKTGDPDLAMLGAQGLASLGSKEAAAELISAVQNAQPGATKRQLSAALASFSNPDAANLFLGLMGSPQDRELAAAAQSALGNSANAAVLQEIVQRYQASSAADERDGLVAALRYSQSPQCVDALLAILNAQKVVSATEPLGLAAADTLGIIGTTNAVSPLFAYLGNLGPSDTSPVYDSIGRISNPEALPLITSIAYGQVPGSTLYSRMAAVQALGNYSSNLVSPALTWLAQNDPNAGIKDAAGAALQRAAGR